MIITFAALDELGHEVMVKATADEQSALYVHEITPVPASSEIKGAAGDAGETRYIRGNHP